MAAVWLLCTPSTSTRGAFAGRSATASAVPVMSPPPPTLADGLAGEVCQTTLDLCRALGVPVRLVPERAILPAIGETLLREHLAVEGSAAVAVAAVLQGLLPRGNGPVALVLSGGNVDPDVLAHAVDVVGRREEDETAP